VGGDTLGLAKLREQVTLQPTTQKIVRLNGPKIDEQSVFIVEPIINEIGLVSMAQENAPAADMGPPCYLTGKKQRDYPRPNGYRNRHRRYLADRVRVPQRIFRRRETDREHKTIVHGIMVLRKMTGEVMLKIIIKIIAIHLFLNLLSNIPMKS